MEFVDVFPLARLTGTAGREWLAGSLRVLRVLGRTISESAPVTGPRSGTDRTGRLQRQQLAAARMETSLRIDRAKAMACPYSSEIVKPVFCCWFFSNLLHCLFVRAVDPHSYFADQDLAVFLLADPDPAAFLMRIRINL